MTNPPEESPEGGPYAEAGLAENVLRVAAETDLKACSGNGTWWLEGGGGIALTAVMDEDARASAYESRGAIRQRGKDAGERVVVDILAAASGVESPNFGLDAVQGAEEEAWSDAAKSALELRLLLNAWVFLTLGPLSQVKDGAGGDGYRQAAEDCYYAVVMRPRVALARESSAEQSIDVLVGLPQPEFLAVSVGQRARHLAERIREHYDAAVYASGFAEALYFARPAALPFTVDVKPLAIPDPPEAAKLILLALLKDSKHSTRTTVSRQSHHDVAGALSPVEAVSVFKMLGDKEGLLWITHWIRTEVKVENESGRWVEPPWTQVSEMLDALGQIFGTEPLLGSEALATAYREQMGP